MKKINESKKELLRKIAEDDQINNTENAATYSDEVFEKLLSEIKIEGLED